MFGWHVSSTRLCLGAQSQQDYRKWHLVRGGNIMRVNFINFIDQ